MKRIVGVSGTVLVCILLLYCAWNRNNAISNEVKTAQVVDETEAGVISEIFIKSLLKYPDDVIFDKSTMKVFIEPDSIFKVTGSIKANNSFGQAIPYIYNIRIKYEGGDWSEIRKGQPANWTFMGGNIYNEVTKEFTEYDPQDK